MTADTPTLNEMAETLINQLDRKKIFPPSYNNPEELINQSSNKSKGPPRPPNGFLLCRKNVHREATSIGISNMRVVSKVSGILWRGATPEEKETYEKLSAQVNRLHSQRYPGYKYRPTSRQRLQQPYYIPNPNIIPILPTQMINQQQPVVFPTLPSDFTLQLSQLPQFSQQMFNSEDLVYYI